MSNLSAKPPIVRGTELLTSDSPVVRRQKLARITLDSMIQFVGLLDANGTVLEINQVALDGVGIDLTEVEGKPFWTTFWWQVSEEINRTLRESIARAAQGELVRWDTAIYGRASGKETIIIDASLCPVRDHEGNVVFICAEGRDISEKKAQERELAQKNLELQALLERIRELDEIKTQFFANVSHELRTPLALILGPARRLIDDDGTMPLGERRDSAQVVARNALMLLRHVNDLLDMSKLEARKLKIELQDTDVAALTRFLASHFAVLAAERDVQLEVGAREACVAAVDPDKLQRVLMNLLGNAFKFTPAGGHIRCSLRRTDEDLAIAVEDSGPGVKPALRQAIFERFRQGDGGTNRARGGTGLGLAIAKEFIEMHKGRIEVSTSDLGGARFEVIIPRHRLKLAADARPADSTVDRNLLDGLIEELRPTATRRPSESALLTPSERPLVLVVEDNADMNRFVCQCLSKHYEIAAAFDGREGLEQAMRLRPALVLSDIMMPHVSGVELVSEMRKTPELQSIPILLLSAKADEDLMAKLLDEGAQDFIVKPFSEKDLLVRVRNLIVAQQARQETSVSLARERQARREIELQKRVLHSLFTQAPALIAVLRGPNHIIELANPPICEAWGRPEKELVSRPLFEAVPELHTQRFPALLEQVYRTGAAYIGKEVAATLRGSDGQSVTRHFNFVYSPYRDVDGQIEGIFVVATDVTEQVASRDQLESLRAAAESANRAKDEFLAMLGHELRNPLSPIVTALELMKSQGSVAAERARTVIERQVNHLTRLVDDLLDVSRIARGKVELEMGPIELADIVSKAVEMVSPLIEQRGHALTVEVPARGLRVDGDPTRLAQVVSNLLTNAAKYTPPGGRVQLRARAVDNTVELRVCDNGIGIARDVLPHVFDLFVQERQAIDRSRGGLGLGLAIVRSLIERHGGTVVALSEGPGRGSEFIVKLPRIADGGVEHTQTPATGIRALQPGARATRVLIVDDNEDAADMLGLALTDRGYETKVVHDPPTALKTALALQPDLAIIDIGLPIMDGYELARHMRKVPGLEKTTLIALTGYGQESDRRRALAAGFHHHLVKPVDFTELEEALEAATAFERG